MGQTRLDQDVYVNGQLSSKTFSPPAASIGNAAITGTIVATKLESAFNLSYAQTGTVVAATTYLRIVRGATAEVVSIEAAITETIATGADRTVTIDLKRSTAGGAFATVLSAPIVLDNTNVLRTLEAGTVSLPDLVDGDILQLTVAVAGAAGNQALGLVVAVTLREDPS